VREAADLRHPPLLLYAQEIEPQTGRYPGNFPRVFSHLTLINTCVHLIREDEPIAAG
jgi:GH15 family glucan-1,4-alpha-glucosidase